MNTDDYKALAEKEYEAASMEIGSSKGTFDGMIGKINLFKEELGHLDKRLAHLCNDCEYE